MKFEGVVHPMELQTREVTTALRRLQPVGKLRDQCLESCLNPVANRSQSRGLLAKHLHRAQDHVRW